MNFILFTLLAAWSLFGVIFYLSINDEIPNFWKKQLARVISGPIVWIIALFGVLFIVFDWFVEKNFGLMDWLKKP